MKYSCHIQRLADATENKNISDDNSYRVKIIYHPNCQKLLYVVKDLFCSGKILK